MDKHKHCPVCGESIPWGNLGAKEYHDCKQEWPNAPFSDDPVMQVLRQQNTAVAQEQIRKQAATISAVHAALGSPDKDLVQACKDLKQENEELRKAKLCAIDVMRTWRQIAEEADLGYKSIKHFLDTYDV